MKDEGFFYSGILHDRDDLLRKKATGLGVQATHRKIEPIAERPDSQTRSDNRLSRKRVVRTPLTITPRDLRDDLL